MAKCDPFSSPLTSHWVSEMVSLLSFFDHRWIAPHWSSQSAIIMCYYYSPDSSIWLILFSTSLTPPVRDTTNILYLYLFFWPCIATLRAWLCNHHHTPVKINGRSMFYSWLLEMALFLGVETGEREEGGEAGGGLGGERRGEERRDCPMLVGMVTWPGEREPGRKEGGRAFVSRE